MSAKERTKMPVFGRTVAVGVALISPAKADTWGCEVALCMSNPAGPMAVSECIPPIKKLFRHLARGHSFPSCESADSHVNFTSYGKENYEDCPSGAKTVYRSKGNQGSATQRFCETFTPVKDGRRFIEWDRDVDGTRYEVHVVDGKRVHGKVEFKEPPRRSKPYYLEYVVQGKTSRLWW